LKEKCECWTLPWWAAHRFPSQEHGPGIERAIHLRKCHPEIYRSEYSEQRARRNYKRGWDEDGGNPAHVPADNEDNEVPDDLAFRIPGYASSRHDLKRLDKCFIGGRFRCPTRFCCKAYKTVDGLQYHLAKSMCVPSVSPPGCLCVSD
jgi:hypothetical protein